MLSVSVHIIVGGYTFWGGYTFLRGILLFGGGGGTMKHGTGGLLSTVWQVFVGQTSFACPAAGIRVETQGFGKHTRDWNNSVGVQVPLRAKNTPIIPEPVWRLHPRNLPRPGRVC